MPAHLPHLSHERSKRVRPRAARLLIAVPWRQAGLIALCAIAGATVSTVASTRHAPAHDPVPASRTQVRLPVPQPMTPLLPVEAADASLLRLDMDPGAVLAQDGTRLASGTLSASATRPRAGRELDEIDAALRRDPPAAGRVIGGRRAAALPGLVVGLLLGLMFAALRELRGGRMRSPSEAEWALGAPVLGAIPTLSAREREACVSGPMPLDGPLERE